jgi:hypothetical protein
MNRPSLRQDRVGVTLTEIMFALVILAVSFLPIIGVMGSSVKATTKEDAINRAMNLCQEKLNTALQFPFDFFTPNLGAVIDVPIATPGVSLTLGNETIEGVAFSSSLTVVDRPGSFLVPVRNLELGNPDVPSTWVFTNSTINYTNQVHTYTLRVSWVNKGETVARFYTLVTFRARLRES